MIVPLVLAACTAWGGIDVFRAEGARGGPSVLIVGGDGVPATALRQISSWPLRSGRLVLASVTAPFEMTDTAEGFVPFEGTVDELVGAESPDAVLVLREDFDARSSIPHAMGSTLMCDASQRILHRARTRALGALNAVESPRTHGWVAVDGEANVGGTPAMIVTVSSKNPRKAQRPAVRAREFRLAAHGVLLSLGVLPVDSTPDRLLPARARRAADDGPPRVAIYDDDGSVSSSGHGPAWIARSMAHLGMRTELITREEIVSGTLGDFDVVVFGGGLSSQQGKGLGEDGREAVRSFVRGGGGYVGICAGAFLACSERSHALHLIDAHHSGTSGSGVVRVSFSSPEIGFEDERPIKFSGGPILELPEQTTCRVWATYLQDLERSGKPPVELEGTPAVVAAEYGRGRVVAFGPHPERAPGPQESFWRAVRWAAGEAPVRQP